ncbi:MAG: flagellar hook-associated protein FlgK, partial [Alphaproteobacteria bacterium]|nr:flagellar hook-associated protein FlgK [Alphaproteobacteria bacterium]
MTIAALHNALTGLQTSQRALGIISSNIANANTEGYTRKIPGLESLVLDGRGAGVQLAKIIRNVDEYMMRDRRNELSGLKANETLKDYYTQLQDLFGSPQSSDSIAHQMTSLNNAMQVLAINPQDTFAAKNIVNIAQETARQLNVAYERMQDLRSKADTEIGTRVDEINGLLQQIDTYNVQISRDVALSQDGGDLRDKRDVALNRLSELIDISYFERPEGDVAISTRAGRVLLDVDAQTVTHATANLLSSGLQYDIDTVPPPGLAGAIGGLFVGDVTNAGNDVTSRVLGGEIKGLIDARDTVIPALQDQIDELARTLRDQINAAQNAATAYPPPSNLTGTRAFKVPSGTAPNNPAVLASNATLFSGTGLLRIAVVEREPSSVAGQVVRTRTLDLDALRANSGANLDLSEVVTEFNALMTGFATAAYDTATGKVSITATSSTQGVVIESPNFVSQSVDIVAAVPITATVAGTMTISTAAGALVGTVNVPNTALSAQDIADLINSQVPGVTARVETNSGGTDRFLQVTSNTGGRLTFGGTSDLVDRLGLRGQVSTIAASSGAQAVLTAGGTLDFRTSTGTLISNISVAAVTTLTGLAAAVNGDAALTAAGVTATVELVDGNARVRISGPTLGANAGLGPVAVSDVGGSVVASQLGLANVGARGPAQAASLQSKGFPLSGANTEPLAYFDKRDTLSGNHSLALSIGGVSIAPPVTFDPTTTSLQGVANSLNTAFATAAYGTGVLQARIVEQDGYKIEIVDSLGRDISIAETPATGNAAILGFSDDVKGFSHYFGLNDFFVDSVVGTGVAAFSASQSIAVNSAIVQDASLVARARLNGSVVDDAQVTAASLPTQARLTTQLTGLTSGNNGGLVGQHNLATDATNARLFPGLAQAFLDTTAFSAAGNLPALNVTITEYASRILSDNATRASLNADDVSFRDNVVNELENRIEGISGVNIDEELSNLILYQNAFTAAARVITAS